MAKIFPVTIGLSQQHYDIRDWNETGVKTKDEIIVENLSFG